MAQEEIWNKPCTPAEIMERLARKDVRKRLGMMAAGQRRLSEDQLDDLASEVVLAAAEFLSTVGADSTTFGGGKPLTLAGLCKRLAAKASQRSLENPGFRKHTSRLVIRADHPSKFRKEHRTVRQDEWKMPGEKPSLLAVLSGEKGAKRDGSLAVKAGFSRSLVPRRPRFLPIVRGGEVAPDGWGWGRNGVLEKGSGYYLVAWGASPEWAASSLQEAQEILKRRLGTR
jgi:hypothetical protein